MGEKDNTSHLVEVTEPFYGFIVSRGETFIPNFAAHRNGGSKALFTEFMREFDDEMCDSSLRLPCSVSNS
jgi:hypothetical protein